MNQFQGAFDSPVLLTYFPLPDFCILPKISLYIPAPRLLCFPSTIATGKGQLSKRFNLVLVGEFNLSEFTGDWRQVVCGNFVQLLDGNIFLTYLSTLPQSPWPLSLFDPSIYLDGKLDDTFQ